MNKKSQSEKFSANICSSVEMREGIEGMNRNLPAFLEYAVVTAKIRKASYDAHIEQGFTPEQALELCQSSLTI